MDEHTLRVLEFEKVLDLLAAETSFSVSHRLAGEVRPAATYESVVSLQQETAEMVAFDQMGLDISTSGATDIRPSIDAAAIGQALDVADLVDVAQTLRAAWRTRQVIERAGDRVPTLAAIAWEIDDFRREVGEVEAAITSRGEIADDASPQLATTRRELRAARDRLEQRAQAALADAVRRGIAQEGLLTERQGRKVIPIKADFRGQLPGIVHDVSSSGATVFLEPMSVLEAGNEVRELEIAEQREVRRILLRLTSLFGTRQDEAHRSLMALARLDLLRAKARLARKLRCELPPPGDGHSWLAASGTTVIVRGRHPLLRGEVVPLDLDIGGDYPGLLITGPNTGGKTVALKTVGLLTLMAQAGLPVPCDAGSRFVVFQRIDADIGDEQSIEQSLSTFSSHMRNIREILAAAGPGSLVLLDELGAGTDPSEGSALSRAILETLLDRGCIVLATTHHGELKTFAHEDPRLRNASVEFNLETLSPTFHLTIGLPGQSNALAIARRLGIDEAVIERAETQIAPGHIEFEQLLNEIRRERAAAADARRREEFARRETEDLRLDLARRRDAIEQERAAILRQAHDEAENILQQARRELRQIERRAAGFDAAAARERLDAAERELTRIAKESRPRRGEPLAPAVDVADIHPGDTIRVRDIPQTGEALSDVGEDGRVDAQFGPLRMKVSVDRITSIERAAGSSQAGRSTVPAGPPVSMELDLRGERASDAVARCESHIDNAFRAGLPYVRIIHGRGTGALRAAIRQELARHPLVRRYEAAPPNEGGDGVTIAVLAG
ncbi:MAG: endonuclease MutS2 [Dehalococcoidia bacterium]